MNGWKVEVRPRARKDLRELSEGPRRAALDLFAELMELGPGLEGAIELRANPGTWRVRFHDSYRMLYSASRTRRQILVTRIKPSANAYEGMKQ